MKRSQIILIVILFIASVAFYLWSFVKAKKRSDDILREFKKVEQDLSSVNDSLKHSIENAKIKFPVALLKSQTILLIDSLKDEYDVLPDKAKATDLSKKRQPDIKRLLVMMQEMNKLQQDGTGAITPDTITYWLETKKFTEQDWIKAYFEQPQKPEVITYLHHLRIETLQIE